MRFKNLTITLTLTCLSIAAFAMLMLLPISGLCNWTTYNNGHSANFHATLNEENESWLLEGSIDAKSVSAYGSIAILNPDQYSEDFRDMGTAEVSV